MGCGAINRRAAPLTSTIDVMKITKAAPSDLDETVGCLATAFAHDPITGFLLQAGSGYRERVTQFFSLLMRVRMALNMPVLVARDTAGIRGAAMGYTTISPAWPTDLADEWDRFEKAIPGMTDRMVSTRRSQLRESQLRRTTISA